MLLNKNVCALFVHIVHSALSNVIKYNFGLLTFFNKDLKKKTF